MANYSNSVPGVYVSEIDAFPPSVADVPTAIPAFIGYTQTAQLNIAGDLTNVPTRITSLLDYELYFGYGPSYTNFTVQLDANNLPVASTTTVTAATYYMYDSLRLFFDNGGGACYIVSVGGYADAISADDIIGDANSGFSMLTKYDEPTLLLFPDAVSLPTADLAEVQTQALMQCASVGNRFCILDLQRQSLNDASSSLAPRLNLVGTENINTPSTGSIDVFRNQIGMNNLKYAAAYHPYLEIVYPQNFSLANVNGNLVTIAGAATTFKTILGVTNPLYPYLQQYEQIMGIPVMGVYSTTPGDLNNISNNNSFFLPPNGSLLATDPITGFSTPLSNYNTSPTAANFEAIFNYLYGVCHFFDGLTAPSSSHLIVNTAFNTAVQTLNTNMVRPILQNMYNLDHTGVSAGWFSSWVLQFPGTAGAFATGGQFLSLSGPTTLSPVPSLTSAYTSVVAYCNQLESAYLTLLSTGNGIASSLETSLTSSIPGYNAIISILNSKSNLIPPSGAMAGVYAATDSSRGVWKAPANVSLNSLQGVDTYIDDDIQSGMNVDTVAGKSINAIRPFFGEGIMVWGARTLAGNDNNWRYVSVRRFTSFVEESCRRATNWAVFEPNDANLWTKVKSEISNFLYTQWTAGALAGAKPSDAYYVQCGLGITMTAQYILNGYLKVLIGMAVVRPAEFIILEFTQILQVS